MSARPRPISEGEAVLHGMLRDAGIDPVAPTSMEDTWEVFKNFVRIPFVTHTDGVLYQSGLYGFRGADEFYVDFRRQFEVLYPDGEHDHFEQLRCEFRFPVTEQTLRFSPFHEWWFETQGKGAWSRFTAMVEARPEFVVLRALAQPTAEIKQEAV